MKEHTPNNNDSQLPKQMFAALLRVDAPFLLLGRCSRHLNVVQGRWLLVRQGLGRPPVATMAMTMLPSVLTPRRQYHAPTKEHVVVALGGNALLRRHEALTMDNQRRNVREGLKSMASILRDHTVTIVHGNGPQVGLLVLETASYQQQTGLEAAPLDVLDAETEGMIGYMIEQELHPHLPSDRGVATILTQVVVDPNDPAFQNPTKFVGPMYPTHEEAVAAVSNGAHVRPDGGGGYRRVVPSPPPVRLLPHHVKALRTLTRDDCVVICAGGGGIPVVQDPDTGLLQGVEAVVDKDRAACLVGASLQATGLLILTDVPGVAVDYGRPGEEKWIRRTSPGALDALKDHFPAGSMGPKVESAIEFVKQTNGWAAIGSLTEADQILARRTGTWIEDASDWKEYIDYYDGRPGSDGSHNNDNNDNDPKPAAA